MTQSSVSDALLLEGFCAGDQECSRQFVQYFWRRLCCIAFQIVRDSGVAEDVAQTAFERAWRKGAMFDPERGSLDAWMASITRHAAVDWARKKRAIPIDPSDISASPTPESDDRDDGIGTERSRAEIQSALNSLPPAQLRSVVLAGAFSMTAAEVARRECIPIGTAKSRIRLAKQRLRNDLGPRSCELADQDLMVGESR
jgi:RNA polymerase sigma-70 factor (ECF subfamily)